MKSKAEKLLACPSAGTAQTRMGLSIGGRGGVVTILTKLIAKSVVGFYTHAEVTVIFAIKDDEKRPLNVFAIAVAEDRESEAVTLAPGYLGSRIRLKSLQGWQFGVQRYLLPISELPAAVEGMSKTREWRGSGQALHFGDLDEVAPQFVAPDTFQNVPWNHVLKNNFWNGSHVLEWSDRKKNAIQELFDDTARIQELTEHVRKVVPLTLAGLTDRLGNFVIQLPVTVLMSSFTQARQTGNFQVEVAWNPKAEPRELRATCELEFDQIVSGYSSAQITGPRTTLAMADGRGLHRGYIWDDHNEILLAATGPSAFIKSIQVDMHAIHASEPRTVKFKEPDGQVRQFRVSLRGGPHRIEVGENETDDTGGRTQARMYKDRVESAGGERLFVQYKPESGQRSASHQKALADVRMLINKFGEEGAWLWDPYLSARDVLETLFYNEHSGSDLRAITSGQEPPSSIGFGAKVLSKIESYTGLRLKPRAPDFTENQHAILDAVESNWLGFRFEFRIKRGPVGFGFHDRFLIFPSKKRSALAWSLGTSINALGKEHHILQRVDDGQLLKDTFEELWADLRAPEHLIWKKP